MPTPCYGLKHWWRNASEPEESLKRFARRHAATAETMRLHEQQLADGLRDQLRPTTATAWLLRKRCQLPSRDSR